MKKSTKFTTLILTGLMALAACSSIAVSRKQAIQILNEIDFYVENYEEEEKISYYSRLGNSSVEYREKSRDENQRVVENQTHIEISPEDKNGFVYYKFKKYVGGSLIDNVENWYYLHHYSYYEKALIDGRMACTKVINTPVEAMTEFSSKLTIYRKQVLDLYKMANRPAKLSVFLSEMSRSEGVTYKESYRSSGIRSLEVDVERYSLTSEGKDKNLEFDIAFSKSYVTSYSVFDYVSGRSETFEIDYTTSLTKPNVCVEEVESSSDSKESAEN